MLTLHPSYQSLLRLKFFGCPSYWTGLKEIEVLFHLKSPRERGLEVMTHGTTVPQLERSRHFSLDLQMIPTRPNLITQGEILVFKRN